MISECPHCHARIVFMANGQCPGCQKRPTDPGATAELTGSELMREIVSRHLDPKRVKRRLDEIAGIGEDAASVAREHDRFSYGKRRKSR